MTRTIDRTRIAVLYETITGQCQKRGSLHCSGSDVIDVDDFLSRHPGLAAIIVNRADLPGTDQNETFFRQSVAAATSTPFFSYGADRAAQVSNAGAVTSVHYGNVPGLDKSDAGHQLINHASAEIGDTYSLGVFSRKYAVFDATTGLVASVVSLPLGQTPPTTAGHAFVASTTLQVGGVVPIKSVVSPPA